MENQLSTNAPKLREITAQMIPQGEDTDSRRERQKLIIEFYRWWKSKHPLQCEFCHVL